MHSKKKVELEKKLQFYRDELADSGHMETRMRATEKIYEIEKELGRQPKKPLWY